MLFGRDKTWFEDFLDLVPHPLFLVGTGSARLVFANAAAREAGFVSGSDDPRLYATDADGGDIGPGELPWARAARGECVERRYLDWHGPGGITPYLVSCARLPEGEDHEAMVLVSLQDVSDLKATEARLSAALGARDEFLAVATHELKAPLATLAILVEGLERKARRSEQIGAAEVLEKFETIQRQVERLTTLADRLVDVGRIQSRRLHIAPEEFDLCATAREICDHLGPQAARAGAAIEVAACEPVIGRWDRLRMGQVVANLVGNAIKYGEGKPVSVSVAARGAVAVLRVEDRGIGIAAEDVARIFEPFERVTAVYRSQSLGLGLYIVREIVRAHGGVIRVDSSPGRGSTFSVELPIERGEGS